MPYYVTEDFAAGIDTRKHPLTAPPGTLRELQNGHLTPGGEIEKRLAFVRAHEGQVPVLERGMARIGNVVYLITGAAAPADIVYGGLTIRYISSDRLAEADRVMDWDVFGGRLYFTVEKAADQAIEHYYQDAVDSQVADYVSQGKGTWIRTYQKRVYSCAGSVLYFSALEDPTDWNTADNAGFIDSSTNDAEALDLSGIEVYYDQLAFFSTRAVQLWSMDTDPQNMTQVQTLRSIGLAARATPRQYGPGDILFVAPSGIRSLQARDSSNSASVSDVGSPIDLDITTKLRASTQDFVDDTQSMLEDLTGRYWVMFKDETWLLSLFPAPKVRAWSRYIYTYEDGGPGAGGEQLPFVPETLADAGGYVCLWGEDNWLYVLGGADRQTYDNCEVVFITPYINLDRPATWKQFLAMDAAVDGTWSWEVSYDPDNVVWEPVTTITKSTYNDQRMAMRGNSPAISLRATNQQAGYARVANIAVHYNLSKDD